MGTLMSKPLNRVINGFDSNLSTRVITNDPEYTPKGEYILVTMDSPEVIINLDSSVNDHLIIKALCPTQIVPDLQKIDRLYDDILIDNGASIELCFIFNTWYVVSSDGVKLG